VLVLLQSCVFGHEVSQPCLLIILKVIENQSSKKKKQTAYGYLSGMCLLTGLHSLFVNLHCSCNFVDNYDFILISLILLAIIVIIKLNKTIT